MFFSFFHDILCITSVGKGHQVFPSNVGLLVIHKWNDCGNFKLTRRAGAASFFLTELERLNKEKKEAKVPLPPSFGYKVGYQECRFIYWIIINYPRKLCHFNLLCVFIFFSYIKK